MKIAIFVDPYLPVPPLRYGGTERVIYNLVLGLKKHNHQITLFGSADSQVPCKIISCCQVHCNNEMPGITQLEIDSAKQTNINNLIFNQSNFDIIHWHAGITKDILCLKIPVLITPHIPYNQYQHIDSNILAKIAKIPHSSISVQYQKNFPNLFYVGNAYHGLDIDCFQFSSHPKNYIAFIGRFSRDKQPHLAMKFAIEHKLNIVVAGKIDAGSHEYFTNMCQPLLNHPLVEYVGEVNDAKRNEIFMGATVNFHLLDFEEPFGLTIVEAGLTGTPTIAYRRGSIPELIIDGQSGFIANNYSNIFKLYQQALLLDRKKVRQHFEKFSLENMTSNYENIYKTVIDTPKSLYQP